MQEDANATEFLKSLQGLKDVSSQLYHAADYCEKTFFKTEDKRIMVETTKAYISRAVVTVVDHLGSISANLESCICKSNSIPETEHKIDILKLRIATCQQLSHKLALPRFYWNANISRHHCRYILPPLTDSIEAKIENEDEFETEEPLFMHSYNCKPSLTRDVKKKNGFSAPVVQVRDGLSILPRGEKSSFQFEESEKLKQSIINWKAMKKKNIRSVIGRGKRIILA